MIKEKKEVSVEVCYSDFDGKDGDYLFSIRGEGYLEVLKEPKQNANHVENLKKKLAEKNKNFAKSDFYTNDETIKNIITEAAIESGVIEGLKQEVNEIGKKRRTGIEKTVQILQDKKIASSITKQTISINQTAPSDHSVVSSSPDAIKNLKNLKNLELDMCEQEVEKLNNANETVNIINEKDVAHKK
jgi:hypothetical protein